MTVFLGAGITDMRHTWLSLLYFEIPVSFFFFFFFKQGIRWVPPIMHFPLPCSSPPSPRETTQDHFHLGEQAQTEGLPTPNV